VEVSAGWEAQKLNAGGLIYIHLVDHSAAGAPTVVDDAALFAKAGVVSKYGASSWSLALIALRTH